MSKGRRAADRRRERGGQPGPDDDPGTTPGAVPHDDYVEVDDGSSPGAIGPRQAAADRERFDDLPEASAVPIPTRSMASSSVSAAAAGARPTASRGPIVDEDPIDVDHSFARELKRRPDARATRSVAAPDLTEIRAPKTPKRPRIGGALVVLHSEGEPAVGAVLSIAVVPALLGRSRDADLRLLDPTVSLRHAELDWDPDASVFFLTDVGSSSGTLRNGELVDGRVALSVGDVIAVGKTELRLQRAEAPPAAKPPPPPPAPAVVTEPTERLAEKTSPLEKAAREADRRTREEEALRRRLRVRRRALFVIATCLALFGGAVVVEQVSTVFFGDTAPGQIRHQVAMLLSEAHQRLQSGEVDEAATRVETILGLDPNNDEAQSLDRVVATEKSARDALQLALRLGDEDRDEEALAALARIADTSIFAKDRERLRQSLAGRALVRSLRAVERWLEEGRIDDAVQRAREHTSRFPADPGGRALLERALAAKAGAPRDPGLLPARAAFADGRIDDARRIAQQAGYAGFVGELDRFERALLDGKAALTRFDGSAARGPLDEAFRLLGSLGASSSSPVFATVQKPYTDALYLSGTEKLEAGDRCGAARDLFRASRASPRDTRIATELRSLQALADQGLQKARGARSEDPQRAASIARSHLCLAPTGSRLYDELAAIAR
jgi:hypothetical protein